MFKSSFFYQSTRNIWALFQYNKKWKLTERRSHKISLDVVFLILFQWHCNWWQICKYFIPSSMLCQAKIESSSKILARSWTSFKDFSLRFSTVSIICCRLNKSILRMFHSEKEMKCLLLLIIVYMLSFIRFNQCFINTIQSFIDNSNPIRNLSIIDQIRKLKWIFDNVYVERKRKEPTIPTSNAIIRLEDVTGWPEDLIYLK